MLYTIKIKEEEKTEARETKETKEE